jgi:hypothetical protein
MIQNNPLQYLPTAEELPDSDGIPVDNELPILIPILLRAILALLWAENMKNRLHPSQCINEY